ncbi:cyclase family protein [Nocardiopsis sp. MG754419]|uniref:cyclase family protein n=1 Tax=Nocardiopsis sp. MG754419 TaxID=2259865 RepID=UPI001BA7D3E6|nr:cyclase family protein [Nocardiopsis sp. MG754419]MBR8740650.1 cyclase family protein [Nocardiopsis sp. MG754419]
MTTSPILAQLIGGLATGDVEIVDLTTRLGPHTPTLRLPEPFVDLIDFRLEQVSSYDAPGPYWRHHNIHTGEHVGTHLDAPIHWVTGQSGLDVSQIPPSRLVGPAAVIDVSAEAAEDPDFLLEIDHIRAWEAEHGPLPNGCWLLLRTGWDQYGHDQELFLNTDENGSHTPGISADCARRLAEDSPISGLGVETVGIDAGNALHLDPPFPVHHHLLGNDRYGVTSLRNLAHLPPTGAVVVVSPLPIIGGTGSPARVIAFVDRRTP